MWCTPGRTREATLLSNIMWCRYVANLRLTVHSSQTQNQISDMISGGNFTDLDESELEAQLEVRVLCINCAICTYEVFYDLVLLSITTLRCDRLLVKKKTKKKRR